MTALIPFGASPFNFEYSGQQVRTTVIDGEPWFAAHDVCNILGYLNARDAVARHVPVQLRGVSRFPTPLSSSGFADLTVINEAGLYRLIMRSNATGAAPFQAWVTEEVLPAIRKTGNYGAPALPDMSTPEGQLAVLDQWRAVVAVNIEQAREIEQARAELTVVKPQAEAWNTLADTGADYSVREAAYILNRDPSISTGQVRLFRMLRDWRLIGRDNKPYANHAKHVTLRPQTRRSPMGERISAAPQVRVTVEGLAYLHKRMGGTAPLDASSLDGAA